MWSNKYRANLTTPKYESSAPASRSLPKRPKNKFIPTAQDCDIILAYFTHNNYQDFNTWQQVSHSRTEVEFIDDKNSAKTFKCQITLTFEDPLLPKYVQVGQGRGKKEAKKQALEKTISKIVWDGNIGLGFKDDNFMQKLPRRKREEETLPQAEQQGQGTLNQSEISSHLQEIARLLERDEFDRALDLLSKNVFSHKSPQFSQVSALWTYALNNRSLLCIRDILLCLHNLPKNHQLTSKSQEAQMTVNALLKKQYGFGRQDTTNPYQVYDKAALQLHYEEYQQEDTFKPNAGLFERFHQSLDNELVDVLKPCRLDPSSLCKLKDRRDDKFTDKLRKQLKKQRPILKPPLTALISLLNSEQPKIDQQMQDIILEWTRSLPPVYNTTQMFQESGLVPPIRFNPFEVFPPVVEALSTTKTTLSSFDKFQNKGQSDSKNTERKQSFIASIITKGLKVQIPKFTTEKPLHSASKTGQKVCISSKLLDALYQSILYVNDYRFVLNVAELIYANCKVKLEEANTSANPDPEFYAKRKNQIVCQFIEKLHHQISLFHMGVKRTTLQGLITSKNSEDNLIFTPKQQQFLVEAKLSKKINTNEFEQMAQIAPGEFGLLQSIHDSDQVRICCFKECNPVKVICPSLKLPQPTPYRFIKLTNRKFYDKLSAATLNISRKNMALLNKSNVHLIWHFPTCNRNYVLHIVLDWVRSGHIVLVVANDLEQIHLDLTALGLRPLKLTPQIDQRQFTSFKPQVVCASINGCASEAFKNATFTRVLINEANCISEVMTLLPLAKGCKKVVLVGDPQLPGPIVMSPFSKSKGMCISLFQRLLKEGHQISNYTNQAKLHSSISNWISAHFYNHELQSDKSLQMTPTIKGFPWPSFDFRICVIDVKGKQEYFGNSVLNVKQAELAVHILASVLQAGFTQLSQTQILTAHESQRQYTYSLLNNLFQMKQIGLKDKDSIKPQQIESLCCLVDAQQNISKDFVVFTACRTHENIGALVDPRKINAFMSRAKRGLVIIANIETLVRGSTQWHSLISWAAEKGLIMSAPI